MKYLFLLLFPFLSFSQTLKTYEGIYQIKKDHFTNGTANYTYFENDKFERVYEGKFSFTSKNLVMSGNFKNGLREGVWKFIRNGKDWLGPYKSTNEPFLSTIIVTYKAGKLNGQCSYTNINPVTKKTFITSTATFKNNLLIGKYEFASLYPGEDKYSIHYQCDSLGRVSGDFKLTCVTNGIPIEDLRKYEAGRLKQQICRDISTGNKFDGNSNENVYEDVDFWIYSDNGSCEYCLPKGNTIYVITTGLDVTNLNSIDMIETRGEAEEWEAQKKKDEESSAKKRAEELKLSQYTATIKNADELFRKNIWEEAKLKYIEALQYKDDNYAKDKIKLSEDMLKKQERINDSTYTILTKQAGEQNTQRNHLQALKLFEDAQKIKPKSSLQPQINQTKDSIVSVNIKKADSLLSLRQTNEAMSILIETEKYSNTNNIQSIKSRQNISKEIRELKGKAYSRYTDILYQIEHGGGYDKNAAENYKTLFKSADEIQNLNEYKQRLQCLVKINDNIFPRLLGDPSGISKDLKKSQKFMDNICK